MATDVAVLKHGEVGKEHGHACCKTGPGYATPLAAMSGPREALIYVTCVYAGNYELYDKPIFISFYTLILIDFLISLNSSLT